MRQMLEQKNRVNFSLFIRTTISLGFEIISNMSSEELIFLFFQANKYMHIDLFGVVFNQF